MGAQTRRRIGRSVTAQAASLHGDRVGTPGLACATPRAHAHLESIVSSRELRLAVASPRHQPCGWAPTSRRITSSRLNEERTCSRASARAPDALPAASACRIARMLLVVGRVEAVDRLAARSPDGGTRV